VPGADEIAEVAYQKLVARPRSVLGVLYTKNSAGRASFGPLNGSAGGALRAVARSGLAFRSMRSYRAFAGSPEAPRLDGVLRALGALFRSRRIMPTSSSSFIASRRTGLSAESVDDISGCGRVSNGSPSPPDGRLRRPEIGALLVDFVNWLDMVERARARRRGRRWTDLADLAADLRSRINRAVSAHRAWVLATMLTHFGTIVARRSSSSGRKKRTKTGGH